MACDRAVEDEEDHCCLREAKLDHWFLRFLCAAGLHNRGGGVSAADFEREKDGDGEVRE